MRPGARVNQAACKEAGVFKVFGATSCKVAGFLLINRRAVQDTGDPASRTREVLLARRWGEYSQAGAAEIEQRLRARWRRFPLERGLHLLNGKSQAKDLESEFKVMLQNSHVLQQLTNTVVVDPVGLLHFGQIVLKRAQLNLTKLLFEGLVLHTTPGDIHVRHVAAKFPTVAPT